jgi:general secretion pathway protein L
MLRDLVLWWARQMRALLPRSLRPGFGRGDALLIAVQSAHVQLTLRRRGQETLMGRFGLSETGLAEATRSMRRRPRRVILRLASGALLERPVELPLAAERDVDRVLGFEMDRFTPFTSADVVWGADVLQRDTVQRRLLLRLSLVPRRAIQSSLDLLSRAGLTPDWLEAVAPDGTPRRLPLADHASPRSHRLVTIAAGAVVVLGMAVLVTPFVMQWLARDATEQAIAALQPQVTRVEALRRQLADAGSDALTVERNRIGNVLQVLATVTDTLPDDTWLTELSLHQGKLNIAGQSPAAARLIPALTAEPTLRNPAFAAPVTRAPDGHTDLFVIRADLAP